MRATGWQVPARVAALAAAALIAVAGFGGSAAAVRAVVATPTTTTLYLPDLNPKPVGRTTDLIAAITPAIGSGTVIFYDTTGGGRVEIGSAPAGADPYVFGQSRATLTIPADMAAGTYQLLAAFQGNASYGASDSSPQTFTVGPRPTLTMVRAVSGPHDASGATAYKADVLHVTLNVADGGNYTPNNPAIAGCLTLKVDGADAGVQCPNGATGMPVDIASFDVPTAGWALGDHAISAVFDQGLSVDYAGSSATAWKVTLVAGAVEATGVGVQYTTFYPYKDGYRDTVALRGNRTGPASVAVRVYSPANKLLKSWAVASGTGAYAVPWNGRTSAGAMLPTGKYKVVQVLTNPGGTHLTVTSYVTLSAKRMHTYTATLQKGVVPGVFTTKEWVGWQFTLPSALTYKAMTVSVYGWTKNQPGALGAQDYAVCPGWGFDRSCVTRAASLPTAIAWKAVTASVPLDRHGRAVTVFAWAAPSGTVHVKYARVRITYTVLQ